MSGGRGGKARGGPTRVEGATAHCVSSSGACLMSRFSRGARATCVSHFYFETVGPTVPCPVPGWFHGRPMGWTAWGFFSGRLTWGGVDWFSRCWGPRSLCWWWCGHHRGERALDVLDGPGERGVCCDEVFDGGVLLD